MKPTMKALRLAIVATLCVTLTMPAPAFASAASAAQPAQATTTIAQAKSFSQQELDQLLAPVALYPDPLLAQILMASTYPLEVVSADRWVKANAALKGKALEEALQKQSWDPAVKALTVFPQVLAMMSDQIDWTQKLGDAFLAQQKEVMATAQSLRGKAMAEGTLKDSKEQKIVTETVDSTTIIKIEPTDPQVVYVPTYDPTVVYGSWPYPAYPPYYWYPPGYYYPYGGALVGFTAGIIVGAALWGNCIWSGPYGGVNINVNRYNDFNRTNIANGNWSHRVEHRGSVPYRDKAVAEQYGRGRHDATSREAFKGRAQAAGQRDVANVRDVAGQRDVGGQRDFGGASGRDIGNGLTPTAFDAAGGAQTRSFSDRGMSSFDSARASGNFGGGARAGGGFGGGRGGGGRR